MKQVNINVSTALVTVALTAVLTIVSVLAYIDGKPRINATGEYASWKTPVYANNINFNGLQSYAQIDIRNVGDSIAKELKLLTPFDGIYSVGEEDVVQKFNKNITLSDLNPGEGYVIELWAENSFARFYLNEVSVTHTQGFATVDFGYQARGFAGWVSKILDVYGVLTLLLLLPFGLLFFLYITEVCSKKTKKVDG